MAKLGKLTFVTNQPDTIHPLRTYLEEQEAKVSLISTRELDHLASTESDILIIGVDTKQTWQDLGSSELSQLFENHKAVGLGGGGTALFSRLELEIGNVMHGKESQVVVEHAERLPSSRSMPDNLVELYQPSEADVVGVYDDFFTKEHGVPAHPGFEGYARWERYNHHWPIARQGNYVLWGFDAPMDQMTDMGKQVFVNLLIHHRAQPGISLSQARKSLEYVAPGLISDYLTEKYDRSVWNFQVRQVGQIRAHLSWHPKEQELALILNGPDQGGYYAREDGVSPQVITFDVEEEHLGRGTDWRISVACFAFGCPSCEIEYDKIEFQLQLDFPAS